MSCRSVPFVFFDGTLFKSERRWLGFAGRAIDDYVSYVREVDRHVRSLIEVKFECESAAAGN